MKARLAVRMGFALCLGAAAIFVLASLANLHLQRSQLTQLVAASAERIAETIRGSTRDAMLHNDSDGLRRVIQNIGALPGIVRIRVFNKEGRIRTSTYAAETGALVDVHAEQCVACHQAGSPLVRLERKDRIRTFRNGEGQPVLAVIAPVHNEAACEGCHRPTQRVLGVLDVQLSMAGVSQALAASERQMLGGLAATVLAMVLLGATLVWALVLRPIGRLSRAMSAAAQGDLGAHVPVSSQDEVGALASSWNRMTDELLRSRSQLEEGNRTLERRIQEKTAELRKSHESLLLVEKMASLGKLAAVVAHELNNPLAGIRTYARLLRRRLAGERAGDALEETGKVLETIDAEAGRCGDIVRHLLIFGRQAPARVLPADLGLLFDRCRMLLRHQAEMQGTSLEIRSPREMVVSCDPDQIQQLLLALVMNALEATPAGGRVSVEAVSAEPDQVVIRVADTGAGIKPEAAPHIFEPFFTTKEEGKGAGLGLAVAYGIVARHQGRIDFESHPGAGTTFSVHLPRGPSRVAERESEASS